MDKIWYFSSIQIFEFLISCIVLGGCITLCIIITLGNGFNSTAFAQVLISIVMIINIVKVLLRVNKTNCRKI